MAIKQQQLLILKEPWCPCSLYATTILHLLAVKHVRGGWDGCVPCLEDNTKLQSYYLLPLSDQDAEVKQSARKEQDTRLGSCHRTRRRAWSRCPLHAGKKGHVPGLRRSRPNLLLHRRPLLYLQGDNVWETSRQNERSFSGTWLMELLTQIRTVQGVFLFKKLNFI